MTTTITIRHTHEDGTLVYGMTRGDGVYELLVGARTVHRFRWFRSIEQIGIAQSRDQAAQRRRIEAAAQAIRDTLGHEVVVEIDDEPRERVQVLADQAERLDDRRDALLGKVTRKADEREALWARSDAAVEGIPAGQPILVGHHSERRHRNAIERSQNAAFAAVAKGREVTEVAQRAAVVGVNAAAAARPHATARRIETLETELRDIDRKLARAGGVWREELDARRALLVTKLEHDRAQLAAAVDAGHRVFGRADVKVGDAVTRDGREWRRVVRVNPKSVSVTTGYSWTDTIKYIDLWDVRTPAAASA